jgi:hypothetical protein
MKKGDDKYMVFQKELYNSIPNVTVWRVLRKRLHLKAYKLSIVQHLERFIACTPLSVISGHKSQNGLDTLT